MYGGNCHGLYTKSIVDLTSLCFKYGIELRTSFLFNESLITRARNYCSDDFIRSDFTHLLFIDSDISFDANDVLALLALDKDIIGAPYSKKNINWKTVAKVAQSQKDNFDFDPGVLATVGGDYVFNVVPGTTKFSVDEPVEVMDLGTGMMLIKRHVFDKMKEEFPHFKYKPDHVGMANFGGDRYIHAYFDTIIDPDSERYLSEDYFFTQNWRKIGGKVYLCPWMKVTHIGSYHYQGDIVQIAKLAGALG